MGQNAEQRLRSGNVDAKRVNPSASLMVPVDDLWQAPEGHPLYDPRSAYDVNLPMVNDMVERVTKGEPVLIRAILVRDEGVVNEKRRLHVCDGQQRTNALRQAQTDLRHSGILKPEEKLYALMDFFTGDDAAFIEERMARNTDKFRRPDSPDILALRVKQLTGLGRKAHQIIRVCPDDVGPKEIDALLRWDLLVPEAKARFVAGAPIGLLSAVLDAPRDGADGQVAVLDRLIGAGLTSAKGATKAVNKERVEKAAAKGETVARKITPKQAKKVTAALLPTPAERKEAFDAIDRLPRGAEHYERLYAEAFAAGMRYRSGEKVTGMPRRVLDAIAGVTGK